MRIVTAGDIVCYAGMSTGMNVSMKNDYNITVLRGQSVSEILIVPKFQPICKSENSTNYYMMPILLR
jgi:hypothetical protein